MQAETACLHIPRVSLPSFSVPSTFPPEPKTRQSATMSKFVLLPPGERFNRVVQLRTGQGVLNLKKI